ncbi:MAG: 2-oxoacid:acceptor oxidoreductase family protein [Eggerthellaceae bacterium]|nr:2-oxoacid:acceptor oxidoreductase family protein [Eggerthellaceae bacterium]
MATQAAQATQNIILAGFGGQGILFAGKLIAYAGLLEGREVSWLPSYGPEMRGGTANCSVCLSDEPIGSPLVVSPDVLVALNQPSFDKFEHDIAPNGLALIDSSLVNCTEKRDDLHLVGFPATKLAEEAGLKGLANVVTVGRLFAEIGFCKKETLFAAVEKCVSAAKIALVEKNKEALELGIASFEEMKKVSERRPRKEGE